MSRPSSPVLTVRSGRSEGSFAAGRDVFVGSDLRADLRIAHPLIARAHLLLRFDKGRWVAIDNNSLNGMFVNGQRVPAVDIRDGQAINIGKPDGPQLSFKVGHHSGTVGLLPPTEKQPVIAPPASSNTGPRSRPSGPIPRSTGPMSRPQTNPSRQQPLSRPPTNPPRQSAPPAQPARAEAQPATELQQQLSPPEEAQRSKGPRIMRPKPPAQTGPEEEGPTRRLRALGRSSKPPATGGAKIGRAIDNDIVIHDVLASRYHAYLVSTPLGTEIRDAQSANGTFVNGMRVGSAVLTEGDVVTIGNVDLTFTNGELVRRTEVATRTGGLEVRDIVFTIGEKALLQNVSMIARPGTLTAIIGGSGAGKSTLSRLVAGYTTPTSGSVTFEGHNIHTEYASLRSRIGMVPQDDVVHRQLTVNQALGYAAELRLPPDTTKADRDQVVAEVLEELSLTEHADKRVDNLSGGQRKRASVALELLTGPSLLILDEPTSGLDPALDLQVMNMLRQLADAGRVVLVVTHSLTYLEVCDQVLLMAPGGKTAYLGPPDQIGDVMGTTNWAHIFAKVGADPEEANRRFLAQNEPPPPLLAEVPGDLGEPAHTSMRRQFSTIARRQIRLVIADRAYFIFLALLPFAMGLLALTVPGTTGFGYADPTSESAGEASTIMTLLTMAAVFMGTALTLRDLIGERPIFRREQAVGLSTTAYLLAKIAVFCVFAIVQSVITTAIVVLGKKGPTKPALVLGNATLELFVGVAATCVAAAMLGLLLSALARSNEQIMPLLVVSLMMQMVLSGGIVPVTNRIALEQMSWVVPARWGYAAQASTVDLVAVSPGPQTPKDNLFKHTSGAWLFDMGMLALLSVVYAVAVRWQIRIKR
ncbi:ABC transporter ATP-binding protein [Mycobacterium sp. 852002-51163_SCH5372311]|uniref:ATP-binding cassette domain-containing protein n=1 Tax=Mycobacterium sp. 852002-51163_SCH5372311 TaxID=1834097 RepID=UPI0007FE8100|nr:ATP-binding cassette domain-containing protein [Mycobacterium sp. 852002-51163_SCH5372311]OBF94397.1 ABC transporter ATP-binding protein [Mycobacterium sp. 852002-51163_SCH5372311]